MVRGHAKEVSQQKNAAKQAAKDASKGRDGAEVSRTELREVCSSQNSQLS